MQERRRRLPDRAEGERLFLSAAVVARLDELRAMGVSDTWVQFGGDGWILMAAVLPDAVTEWVAGKACGVGGSPLPAALPRVRQSLDWDLA